MYGTTTTIFKENNEPLICANFVSQYLEQTLQETGVDYYDEPQHPINMLREFFNIEKKFWLYIEEHTHRYERFIRNAERIRYGNYTKMIKVSAEIDSAREELYNIIKDVGKIEAIKSTLSLFRENKNIDNFYLTIERKYGAI